MTNVSVASLFLYFLGISIRVMREKKEKPLSSHQTHQENGLDEAWERESFRNKPKLPKRAKHKEKVASVDSEERGRKKNKLQRPK